MVTLDAVRYVADSESSPRTMPVDTLQYHHAASLSLAGLEDSMEPGGRRVSANAALDTDGTLVGKVHIGRRAFTSATPFDNRCYTVETVNTSTAPDWGISDESHRRMGKLAAEMLAEGLLKGLWYGVGGIIGHKDVPGTYATACPGPSYDPDLILKYATEYSTPKVEEIEESMYKYIWNGVAAPDKKARYALVSIDLEQGYIESSQLADAKGFSGMSPFPGSPHKLDEEGFNATIRMAVRARQDHIASAGSGGIAATVSLSTADRALLTDLGKRIDALPAEIDRYADGKKQSV